MLDFQLRPMQPDEFTEYRKYFVREWALDIAKVDHISFPEALEQARLRTDQELLQGLLTKDHFLFSIFTEEQCVGTLWFTIQKGKTAFLEDIEIRPPYRGMGYGKRALEQFQIKAKSLGCVQIDLHVYAHNLPAISLYQKMGYHTTGLKMRKMLL